MYKRWSDFKKILARFSLSERIKKGDSGGSECWSWEVTKKWHQSSLTAVCETKNYQ